jgi:hypothetical protein
MIETVCATCGAEPLHNTIRCEQCGKPLVFATSFTCPLCKAVSYNLNDIVNRYCGRCHVFVDDPILTLPTTGDADG